MAKRDRRIQRTREQLQKAMFELISERHYDAITVQDLVDRANVGRTTFYLHFDHKDDLFLSCHDAIINDFQLFQSLDPDDILSPNASPGMIAAYRHLRDARRILAAIFQGQGEVLSFCGRFEIGVPSKLKTIYEMLLTKLIVPFLSLCWQTIWPGLRSRRSSGGWRTITLIRLKI